MRLANTSRRSPRPRSLAAATAVVGRGTSPTAACSGPFKLTSIDIDAGKLVFEPSKNFFGRSEAWRIEITSIEDNV